MTTGTFWRKEEKKDIGGSKGRFDLRRRGEGRNIETLPLLFLISWECMENDGDGGRAKKGGLYTLAKCRKAWRERLVGCGLVTIQKKPDDYERKITKRVEDFVL